MPGSMTADARVAHGRLVLGETRPSYLLQRVAIQFFLARYHWHCERESRHIATSGSDVLIINTLGGPHIVSRKEEAPDLWLEDQ
jgi:hypothetical protein